MGPAGWPAGKENDFKLDKEEQEGHRKIMEIYRIYITKGEKKENEKFSGISKGWRSCIVTAAGFGENNGR